MYVLLQNLLGSPSVLQLFNTQPYWRIEVSASMRRKTSTMKYIISYKPIFKIGVGESLHAAIPDNGGISSTSI